ncbi:hypothetical protein F8M41_021687 [Gigaspora margarita]|uniref:Uncharacterized protein n=1 Tax=Gigaspora margarita TaxID=4874 RepID=A0A8H4EIS8_GIGMA|nr:hypothetical protein F8M41_021687 [Gigaspora margarita]
MNGAEYGNENDNMNGGEYGNDGDNNTNNSEYEENMNGGEHGNDNMNGNEHGDNTMNDIEYFILINNNSLPFTNNYESNSFSSNQSSALESTQNYDIHENRQSNCNDLNTYQPSGSDFIMLTNEHNQATSDNYSSFVSNSFRSDGIYQIQSHNDYSNNSRSIMDDVTTSTLASQNNDLYENNQNYNDLNFYQPPASDFILTNGYDQTASDNYSFARNSLQSDSSAQNAQDDDFIDLRNSNSSFQADNNVERNSDYIISNDAAQFNTAPKSDNSKSSNDSTTDIDTFIKNNVYHHAKTVKVQYHKEDSNSSGLSGSNESIRSEGATKDNKTQDKHSVNNKSSQENKQDEKDEDNEEEENNPKAFKNHPLFSLFVKYKREKN